MGIREVLQIEIWSKETSRRIFLTFGMLGSVLGLFLLGFWSWYSVSNTWVTRSERKTAGNALAQVDALQLSVTLSDEEYAAKYKQAEASVHDAEQAAWTERDKSISSMLSTYLMFTDMSRTTEKIEMKRRDSKDERLRKFDSRGTQQSDPQEPYKIESFLLHEALK